MKRNVGAEWKLRGILLAVAIGLMAFAVAFPTPAWTQGQPADNMKILLEHSPYQRKIYNSLDCNLPR